MKNHFLYNVQHLYIFSSILFSYNVKVRKHVFHLWMLNKLLPITAIFRCAKIFLISPFQCYIALYFGVKILFQNR